MPPTPSEIATIHQALMRCEGDRAAAAALLGRTAGALDEAIRGSRELTALWGRKREGAVPTAMEAYDRDRDPPAAPEDLGAPVDFGLPPGVTPHALAKSDAFHSQDNKLQKFDWEGVGITDAKTLALMRQFETGVGRGTIRMMDAMQGGMAFAFARVSRQLADVADMLEIEQAKRPDGAGEDKRDETKIMLLHARFMDLAKLQQTFNKEAVSAAHTRLLVAAQAKKIQQAAEKMTPNRRLARMKRAEPVASEDAETRKPEDAERRRQGDTENGQ